MSVAAIKEALDHALRVARAEEDAREYANAVLNRRAERLTRQVDAIESALAELERSALELRRASMTGDLTPALERQQGRVAGVLEAVAAMRRVLG